MSETDPRSDAARSTAPAPLRWGMLGTGLIAHDFAADALRAGIAIIAVGSQDDDRAAAFAREFGIEKSFGSYEALATAPDVDVVYVATPSPAHAAHAIMCLRAGKHVLVEKPFTLDHREAAEVADVAERAGLLVQEAMWPRFLPQMARIRELVRKGALGQIRSVYADFSQQMPDAVQERMLDPRRGGGALLDLGAYPVSFAWDLLGAPDRIQAVSDLASTGRDRQSSIVFGYADGAQALLHAQIDAVGSNRAVITGTAARIEIDPVWFTPTSFRLIDPRGEVIETYTSEVAGVGLQFEALAVQQAILAGRTRTTELPIRDSVAIMRVFDHIRELGRTGGSSGRWTP